MQWIERGFRHRAVNIRKLLSRAVLLTVICTLVGLCACESGGQSNSTESSGGSPRTITGTEIVSYVSETGTVDVPDDLSKTTITAYVPNDSGGYDAIPGTGTSDGHYTVPNVAAGHYLLQIGSSYFWTSATNIDTGSQVQGRFNNTQPLDQLDLDIRLSVPITSNGPGETPDRFELVDFNTASRDVEYPLNTSSGNRFNQMLYSSGIEPSLGDKVYLIHVIEECKNGDYGNASSKTRIQAEMTPDLSAQIVPGGILNVNSAMSQGTPGVFRANFALSEFSALSSQMAFGSDQNPGVLAAGLAAAPPFAVNGGFPGTQPSYTYQLGTLATIELYPFSGIAPDLDLGEVTYSNGFPPDYKMLVFADWSVPVYFTFGGASGGLTANITMNSLTTPTATKPLRPLVGPVTTLSLDGSDVFGSQLNGVSLTPTVAWGPPEIGIPNFYQVDLVQLTLEVCAPHSSCVVPTNMATFQTQQTSLKLPPGVLASGSAYALVVTAKNAVASSLASAPMRTTYPFAYADVVSQMFTTAGTASADSSQTSRNSYGPLMRNRNFHHRSPSPPSFRSGSAFELNSF